MNEYLLYYEEPIKAQDGISDVSMFLGDWFIRKAMWASKAHIKSNAASKIAKCLSSINELRNNEKTEFSDLSS